MKSSPLDQIKIASPCPADWNEMRGDKRKRFCTHCRLNVYNLSEMTRREAENLLFETEGKICVKLYRREDGTVITQNCPVGWQAVKQKVSRVASAVFGLIAGLAGGLYGYSILNFDKAKLLEEVSVEKESLKNIETGITVEEGGLTFEEADFPKEEPFLGKAMIQVNKVPIKSSKKNSEKREIDFAVYGGISNGPELMWLFTERYPK